MPSAVGTTATYKCDSGYTINGGASLTCQASGKWSAAPPTCVVGELQPVHLHITYKYVFDACMCPIAG